MTTTTTTIDHPAEQTEASRLASLLDAQEKANALFAEIEPLIRPGISEKALSDSIHKLGQDRHGVRTHWHKRVVRSGENTLRPFQDNPPDRIIGEDDILVVDLGPVFEKWEADFGRTYVLGNDPEKERLRRSLEPMWWKVKAVWDQREDMTGEELYDTARKMAEEEGWKWGADIAGHIVGDFPHERYV
ncbi:Creatinase/aminopeptidase [Myriangium duriaei CBS 260.36]|uniref:Creatinase/aminopeptidase n=1 Tax=Myriangium duriaei CBS 260.36 TaxID=1168546 RepID=A0A9P4J4P1_9PEZI|nr:Creatinase/aminopeptidase [Myriangium duriaei CBS 260.36]